MFEANAHIEQFEVAVELGELAFLPDAGGFKAAGKRGIVIGREGITSGSRLHSVSGITAGV